MEYKEKMKVNDSTIYPSQYDHNTWRDISPSHLTDRQTGGDVNWFGDTTYFVPTHHSVNSERKEGVEKNETH